jgi:hypothetical protein
MLNHLPWPYLERSLDAPWMLFVDGENLAIQGQKVAAEHNIRLMPGPFYRPHAFLWFPGSTHAGFLLKVAERTGVVRPAPTQSHYYPSVVGDDSKLEAVRKRQEITFTIEDADGSRSSSRRGSVSDTDVW